jgi:glucose-1-phosphate adenylyltransferase
VLDDGRIENSLLSGGTRVSGDVRGSVLSPGVIVEAGATVVDSVLLPGVRVRAGATVTRAVVDDAVDVGQGASVGGDGDITLLGRGVRVDDGAEIAAGARFPDPDQE